jgi:O-antigen/teichoic acid export membrane protein
MAFGKSISFWLILCLFAPLIARFYANPELTPLFMICATGLLFDGAMSAKAYVAIKEMKFPKWAMINHGGAIFGVAVTVALSFLMKDVWALAIGYAAESFGRCVLSFVICPYLPPFKWNRAAVKDLLRFSKNVFGLSLLNLVFARSDVFVIAKLRSTADLGLYTMAVYFVQTPANFLMNLLGQTIMPTFARIQGNVARVNRILLQVTAAIVVIGMPLLVFVAFYARALLTLAYGHRYAEAAGALIVASGVALLNLVNGQITSVFFANGQPHLHRRSILIMAGAMLVLVYPFVLWFGLIGGQLACLAAMAAGFVFQAYRVHVLNQLNLTAYAGIFVKSAGLSLVIAAVCYAARFFVLPERPLPNLVCGIAGCLLTYGAAYPVLRRAVIQLMGGQSAAV